MRRAVHVECQVWSDYWDEAVELPASDLSHEGVWLDSALPLDPGEQLLLTFAPPQPDASPLHALAEVTRVGMWRRARDRFPVGMGLCFTDLAGTDRDRLREALIGIPPRLPRRRSLALPPPLPPGPFADLDVPAVLDPDLPDVDLDFEALGSLVTSPRPAYVFAA